VTTRRCVSIISSPVAGFLPLLSFFCFDLCDFKFSNLLAKANGENLLPILYYIKGVTSRFAYYFFGSMDVSVLVTDFNSFA